MVPKLRIAQISLGDGYAGSHRFALLSSAELKRRGHDLLIVVTEGSLTEKRAGDLGLEVRSLPADKEGARQALGAILDGWKPGFAVAHHSLERKLLMNLRIRGRAPYKTYAFRNIVSRSFPFVSGIPYSLLLDGQIACSKGVARSLYWDGAPPWKVFLAYNGIEIPDLLPPAASKASLGAERDDFLIGMSAWFHPKRKGFDLAFKALAPGLGRKFKLLLIGVAPEHQDPARALASKFGLDPSRLLFPGYVENIWPLYRALDAFILPSREEGFSLSLLEAMASGLPCIASRIPGNDEAFLDQESGLFFPVSNSGALRDRLQSLIQDPALAQSLGEKARTRVLENFTIAHSAASLEEIFLKA